jgi:hypothetical protein
MRPNFRPGALEAMAAAMAGLLFVVSGLLYGAFAADGDPPIRALHWMAKDADPVRAVATQPTECLRLPADAAERLSVEVGRAAFRTPVLLGGQAARASLACETCHKDGRTNPDFQFPGVSGAPGTADVTDSLFSSHRGDGIDNPKPIPDLSGPKSGLKIDQSPHGRALETFIHGLITQEFDGPEPDPAVLNGLAAYVRALSPDACPAPARQSVDAALLMSDARRALAAAQGEIAAGDRPAAVLMLAAARARLGLIDERLADAPGLEALRARLRAASMTLAGAQAELRAGRDPPPALFVRWLDASRPLEAELAAAEPGTLFAAERLRAAVHARPAS